MSGFGSGAGDALSGWRLQEILISGLQHAAGGALVLSASVLALTDQQRAAFSALSIGFLIFGLAAANQMRPLPSLFWATAVAGLSAICAPWLLGFADDVAIWAHAVSGGVALAAASYGLGILPRLRTRRRPN